MSAASSSSPLPPTAAAAVAEATSSTSANDAIANPFSFSGFSDELFGEIDLDDIDSAKLLIDDDSFFEDFAIDSDGEGEEASGVAAPAAASSLTASPPPPVHRPVVSATAAAEAAVRCGRPSAGGLSVAVRFFGRSSNNSCQQRTGGLQF
jgi:hypothetical protein